MTAESTVDQPEMNYKTYIYYLKIKMLIPQGYWKIQVMMI